MDNAAVDALSRVQNPELLTMVLCTISVDQMSQVKQSWSPDANCAQLLERLPNDPQSSKFIVTEGLLCRKGKLVVRSDIELRQDNITLFNASSMVGHSGVTATLKRIPSIFYSKRMCKNV